MINYQFSLLIAITAVVYSYILTRPGQALSWAYNKLDVFFKTDERAREGKDVSGWFMVLMYCEKCVAGQWANILYLYFYWYNYLLLQHVFFMAVTILLSSLIKNLYVKYIE